MKSSEYIVTKDYTVTNETYTLLKDKELDLLITTPVPEDLGKYYASEEYISHTDSTDGIMDKIYQIVKKYNINTKFKLVKKYSNGSKNILDIGAGTGEFLLKCKQNSWNVIGVEPNERARNLANTKELKLLDSIEKLDNKKFDIITLWHVLEHIPEVENYIIKLKNLLTEDGTLVIAVPNYNSYDAKKYKEYWAAYDVPRHLYHFSQKSIETIFKKISMNIIKTVPMKFDAFYVSLLSEKYKYKKNRPIHAFLSGLQSNLKAIKTNEYSSLIYILKNNK